MTLSTHVLDQARGKPAAGIAVTLCRIEDGDRLVLAHGETDADGRVHAFGGELEAGWHELIFDAGAYFAASKTETFYGEIAIRFNMTDSGAHYHVPLLLSPFGYSTYRGS